MKQEFEYFKLLGKKAKDIEKKQKEIGGYCTCLLVRNDDTKCICKKFREQQNEGVCHCGLYYKRKKEN